MTEYTIERLAEAKRYADCLANVCLYFERFNSHLLNTERVLRSRPTSGHRLVEVNGDEILTQLRIALHSIEATWVYADALKTMRVPPCIEREADYFRYGGEYWAGLCNPSAERPKATCVPDMLAVKWCVYAGQLKALQQWIKDAEKELDKEGAAE